MSKAEKKHDPDEQTSKEKAIHDLIKASYPDAKFMMTAIFPNGSSFIQSNMNVIERLGLLELVKQSELSSCLNGPPTQDKH